MKLVMEDLSENPKIRDPDFVSKVVSPSFEFVGRGAIGMAAPVSIQQQATTILPDLHIFFEHMT